MSAPYQHGKDTVVYGDGYTLTSDLTQSAFTPKRTVHEYQTYGMDAIGRQPGLRDGEITLGGWRNTAILPILQSLGTVLTRGQFGGALGAAAEFAAIFPSEDVQDLPSDELLGTDVKYACNGRICEGVFLHALAAETTDHDTTGIDNGSDTATGYTVTLQATAITSTPTMTVLVQHSPTGSVWSTLATFANVTAIGAQLLQGTGTETVEDFVRLHVTLSGGTVTYTSAFARHQ